MSEDHSERADREPAFKVIDRRRFAADGSERPEEGVEEIVRPAVETAPPREGASAQEPEPPAMDRGPGSEQPAATANLGEPSGEPYEGSATGPGQSAFATLVLSLCTQVLMALGEIPEEPGSVVRRDLVAARNVIDLLSMLQQKTQGNLDDDERKLLDGMLYDLRMRFVELSGADA